MSIYLKILWSIFMSRGFRWFLFILVFILNFIAYYQDPSRYTVESECYNMPCKWFNYVAGLGTFTMDVFTFIGLWYTIGPSSLNWLPDYWYVPFIIIGYAIITQITIDSPTVQGQSEILSSPPKYLWPQKWRIILYSTILLLDIIIFSQLYIDSSLHNYNVPHIRVFDMVIGNQFGGWKTGNKFQFLYSWVGIIGILIDIFALYFIYTFNACVYKLPISWNF